MFYIMSDLHGSYVQMEKALKFWDPEKEHLVIMGDLIDRGPGSLEVVQKAMELKEKYPDSVTVLKGNHEEMFLEWLLKTPMELMAFYYTQTHEETLKSFMGEKRFKKSSRTQRAEHILYNHKKELRFLYGLPLYFETENCLFVHAGINLRIPDWKQDTQAMTWIRNEFIYSLNSPEKRVFFGHTPTKYMHKEEVDVENSVFNVNSIWMSDDKMKIGIDGAVSMGGQLNALKVNEYGEIMETLNFK